MFYEFGFENPPLEFLFDCYLSAAIDYLAQKSVDAYRSRLMRAQLPMNWIEACDKAGINAANHVDSHSVAVAKRIMKKACAAADVTYGHFDSAFNAAMKWAIAKKFVNINVQDLKAVRQGRKAPPKIVLAPDVLIQVLCTQRLGNSTAEHLRNQSLFPVCLVRVGLRTGKEVLCINEQHINWENLDIRIRREDGHIQVVPFRREDMGILRQWVEAKKQLQRQYLEAGGKPANDEDALFVSLSPKEREGVLTWRMSKEEIALALQRICAKFGVPYVPPSVLRRNSCVMAQTMAMAASYHESYASVVKGHEPKTERDHYSGIIGPEIELLNRLPQENVELLERIHAHAMNRFMEHPLRRHLACAKTCDEMLGRLELRKILSEYQKKLVDLDRVPSRPHWANCSMKTILLRITTATLVSVFPWSTSLWTKFSINPKQGGLS